MFDINCLPTPEYFSNPLLAREFQNSESISIYSPAVTSSGDVYHIAAYCLLCEHFSWRMPKVFLCYDVEKTEIHAKRAQSFLRRIFGVNIECHLLKAPTTAYHYNPRNNAALLVTKNSGKVHTNNELIINQKMLTSLINSAFMIYGFGVINKILRHGFKNKRILKYSGKPISAWIARNILATKKAIKNLPFVILHNRFSQDANDKQNLSNNTLVKIINILRTKGIDVILVNVSSENCAAIPNVYTINAFEKINNLDPIYCKFQHTLLLSALSDLSGCKGIIGGTSGTLDVLAFMGINILNIHNFSEHKRVTFAPHQDFRLLLQSVFMSVCSQYFTENTILFWLLCRNFLFNYGTIPLSLNDDYDTKKDREIFKMGYSPNHTTRPINQYYAFQKCVLHSKTLLSTTLMPEVNKFFDGRSQIQQDEQIGINTIIRAMKVNGVSYTL